jgi:hypothetical protein
MVHSLKLTIITDGKRHTGIGFSPGETIYLGSLEFIADRFDSMSLSLDESDSGVVFVGMVPSGSSSLYTILEESTNEGDTASNGGGSSSFPIS